MQVAHRLKVCDAWLARGVRQVLETSLSGELDSLRYTKAICEIGFFAALQPHAYSSELLAAVQAALGAVWRGGRLLCVARHNLHHANLFVPLLWSCGRLLDLSSRERSDIKKIGRLALQYTKERVPFRAVDLRYVVLKIEGVQDGYDELAILAGNGCLRRGATPDMISAEDDYAVTHTIFYITDFGRRSWPQSSLLSSPEDVDSVLETLRSLPINADNLDLRGEFLLARSYMSVSRAYVQRELKAVLDAQEPAGWWPGPSDLSPKLREESVPSSHWDFMLNYHTTLVCREAVAAWLAKTAPTRKFKNPDSVQLAAKNKIFRGQRGCANSAEIIALRELEGTLHNVRHLRVEALLLDPLTISEAADFALFKALTDTLTQTERHGFSRHGYELLASADQNDRVQRLGMLLIAAAEGPRALSFLKQDMRIWFSRLVDSMFDRASIDQCYVLALAVWAELFEDEQCSAARQVLRLAAKRCMGSLDVVGVGQFAVLAVIADLPSILQSTDQLLQSLRSASIPFGFLDPSGHGVDELAARFKIARARSLMARQVARSKLKRNTP
jgi:hypothetical protein